MRSKWVGLVAWLLLLGTSGAVAQTAVPVWEQLYRPAPPPPFAAKAIASRELADGTLLVVTDQFVCVHFGHDGTPLSSTQLPISTRSRSLAGRADAGSRRPVSPDITAPLDPGAAYAAIDGVGRVVVAFVADPGPFFPQITGDIETNKFDGLTGQALWPEPQVLGGPGGRYPTGIFLDRNNDVIVTGLEGGGGSSHITIKYRGTTGEVVWGPQLILAASGTACLDSQGDVFVTLGRNLSSGFALATLRYAGTDGSIVWGPIDFSLDFGVAPSVCAVTPTGLLAVAGYGGFPRRLVVLAYNASSSAVEWGPVFVNPPAGVNGVKPTSLAADLAGNVVLAVRYTASETASYVTMKLEADSGDLLWGPITTANGVPDSLPDVAIFGNGDVLLRALVSTGTENHLNFWRYRGADGEAVWGPSDLGETPQGFPLISYFTSQVLSDGDVFGTATLDPFGPSAFALDGSTGGIVWGPTPFAVPLLGFARFEDMTTGPDGHPVVVGDTVDKLITIKYDRVTGTILWGPVFFEPGYILRGWQVQIDAAGDAIVLANAGVPILLKYEGATGALLWGPTEITGGSPERFVLDGAGNALVLGLGYGDSGYTTEVSKVSGATGAITWGPVVYDSGPFNSDFPRSIAVDAAGDVYAVGNTEDPGIGYSWFVVKYSGSSGSLLWGPVGGGLTGQPAAIVAGDGRLVVTGGASVGQNGGMATIAFDAATGAVQWGPRFLAGTQPYVDSGQALVMDGAGDVLAAGTLYNLATGADFATIKYRGSDGAVLWGPSLFDGSGLGDYVYTLGLGIDGSGNVVVGGTSYRTPNNSDIAVLKYDASTGATLWGPVYEGGNGDEELYGFGVNGTSVAVGSSSEGGMLTAVFDEAFGIATPVNALALAYCGSPYAFPLVAKNGVTPYSWSIVSGSLPPGVTLSPTGILSGTPDAQGVFTFRVKVQDSGSGTAERDFTITVIEGPSPVFLQRTFGSCVVTLSLTGSWSSVVWLPGGETTPTILVSPIETTTYGAVVDAGSGCTYHLSVTIPGTELQDPACLAPAVLSIDPASGPASGGTPLTITGGNFQAGATVEIGGATAGSIAVVDATQITAVSPALAPGTLYDVTVVNPDTGNAALHGGWFADFGDVPAADPFHDLVVTLVRNGVTAGCGAGNYCPAASVTRAQMAVFLLKARYGAAHVPPPPVGVFPDVPVDDPFAPWIEELAGLGITAGCGGGNYCPGDSVTRAQMAVFLLKTSNGSAYTPPPAKGIFGDVPSDDPFAPWIEQIYALGITSGCNATPLLYCPGSPVTRGQMAVFLVKTFNLQ